MSDAQEMISYSQGETIYYVKVNSFKHKMCQWEFGKVIPLKIFQFDGIKLRMKIFPNGSRKELEHNVSVFLQNLSDVNVDVLLDISFGNKFSLKDRMINVKANAAGFGFGKFYGHNTLRFCDSFEDENFEITLTLKKLWKELTEDDVENRQESSLSKIEQRLDNLEVSMRKLSMQEPTLGKTPDIPYPECPICLENITQDSRIMQCSAGHLICGGCHDQLEVKICPSCKKSIMGRCHGMESYLKSLFPQKKKPATNNNDRVYQCYGAGMH